MESSLEQRKDFPFSLNLLTGANAFGHHYVLHFSQFPVELKLDGTESS